MGHDDVASGYSISTGFRRLTGCQRDPWDRGVTGCFTFKDHFINKICVFLGRQIFGVSPQA